MSPLYCWVILSAIFLYFSKISVHQVNRELKKLLVASVGDDLQYHFERLSREKNHLILENEALGRSLAHTAEQLERMSIQCDVWRSKFLASRFEMHQNKSRNKKPCNRMSGTRPPKTMRIT